MTFIAEQMGLHFPRERLEDLRRGVAEAAVESGFDDAAAYVDWLLSVPLTRAHLQLLASHLTVGETYFFREPKTFEVLATRVLPELIHTRRGRNQRLRVWSAGCCTGEEAYSLAILLRQVLPDLVDWHVTILATDINARALRKAVAGSYGEWSFRDVPIGFKERYFLPTADGRYTVRTEIKQLVTFEHLNLVDEVYPSPATGAGAIDLIFCRNVLMYFAPEQTRKVIGNLYLALADDGWLGVSPSEASQALFPQFVTANFPGVILYQKKRDAARGAHHSWSPPPPPEGWEEAADLELTPALSLEELPPGRHAETADVPVATLAGRTQGPESSSSLARALADQGRLTDALVWCDRWIAADKVDAAGHYLRGVVLLEHGRQAEARRSLQRALYLDPRFVLAHFALAGLARHCDRHAEANRHFANTLQLLGGLQPNDVLPESDGLTAGRLTATIIALTGPRNPR